MHQAALAAPRDFDDDANEGLGAHLSASQLFGYQHLA
jgi:hypothetical protein